MIEADALLSAVDVSEDFDQPPSRPPQVVMWCMPAGRVVPCPNIDLAELAADHFAGRNPGKCVAVYRLWGYSYKHPEKGEFVRTEPSAVEGQSPDEAMETNSGC